MAAPVFSLAELANLATIETACRLGEAMQALFARSEVGQYADENIFGFVDICSRYQRAIVHRALCARDNGIDISTAAFSPTVDVLASDVRFSAFALPGGSGDAAANHRVEVGVHALVTAGWVHPELAHLSVHVRQNRARAGALNNGDAAPSARLMIAVGTRAAELSAAALPEPRFLDVVRELARGSVAEPKTPRPVLVLGVSYS